MITVVESGRAPFLLGLGNDSSTGFRAALDAVRSEVDEWEQLSRSTDVD